MTSKGYKQTGTHKKHLSEAHKGLKHSIEHIKKQRLIMKKLWQKQGIQKGRKQKEQEVLKLIEELMESSGQIKQEVLEKLKELLKSIDEVGK